MPTTYCPSSYCAAEITYSGAKPTVCPRCKQPFAAAFQSLETTPQVTARKVAPSLAPRPAPKPKRKRPGTLAARLEEEGEPIPMSPLGDVRASMAAPQVEDDGTEGPEDEDYDGGEADPDAITATASQILATLDERDIIVQSPSDEWGVRLTRPKPQTP